MWCTECGYRFYVPLDDKETRCLACVRSEERKRASSSAVPEGFWDRTDRATNNGERP